MEQILGALFTRKPSLWFCIAMDIIGMATYFIPALGEWGDVVWAPLSGLIFFTQFGGAGGLFGGAFSFLEELLPFTDIIPTFTLAWYLQQKSLKAMRKSGGQPEVEDAEVIEIS